MSIDRIVKAHLQRIAEEISSRIVGLEVLTVLQAKSPLNFFVKGTPLAFHIGVKVQPHPFKISIVFSPSKGAVYWSLQSSFWENSGKAEFEGKKERVSVRNLKGTAKVIAAEILAAIPKLLKSEEDARQKEVALASSRAGLLERFNDFLKGLRYGPAGRAHSINVEDPGYDIYFTVDPQERQRLDHYGEGESWDSDSWKEDYAEPILAAIEPKLRQEFGGIFDVDVDEKGLINITLLQGLIPAR